MKKNEYLKELVLCLKSLMTTRSPAVAGMDRPFRDVDWTVSVGLIEQTQSWNFVLILFVTDIMDGRHCLKHTFSIAVDKYSELQVKQLKKLKVEILH